MSPEEINEDRPHTYVVGVDYATLPGRTVPVRGGADLGSAVVEYPHAVITDRLPASTQQLTPDWAATTSEVRV